MSPARTASTDDGDADKCPVDHKSREAWMTQARKARESEITTPPVLATSAPAIQQTNAITPSSWGWRIPFFSSPAPDSTTRSQDSTTSTQPRDTYLGVNRVVSSIPRAQATSATATTPLAASTHAPPANNEAESGTSASGNWIYPSEKMFFDAMRRKQHDPQIADMATVVPIHNAVNERAWAEIKRWEAPYTANEACAQGPRLESFSGLSTKMSPRARMKTLVGYTAPFDRHDWVVDRCGTKVEYVIDFYAGNNQSRAEGAAKWVPSFYLDVRPKLNSWEGIRMRATKAVGLT